ncbi:unnamed protein product [Dovyalis caffra]|uniref:Uncharacterized protein n=1 Tax=Dovyalis caffra TaxID=77055 RepID=A0AAV1SL05_9ROSI|nr:unnamed protein product [Dovyalis caffra]
MFSPDSTLGILGKRKLLAGEFFEVINRKKRGHTTKFTGYKPSGPNGRCTTTENNQPQTRLEDETIVSVEVRGVSPHSQPKSQLIQTADVLVEETTQQEIALEDQTMISVEDEQIRPCSQVEGQLVQIAGVKMQETVNLELMQETPRLQQSLFHPLMQFLVE